MEQSIIYFGINVLILSLQFGLMLLYFRFRNIGIKEVLRDYIGLGDLFMFIVLCAFCNPLNYLPLFVVSLIFALLGHVAYNSIFKNGPKSIPLAGWQAVFLCVLLLWNFDMYGESLMLKWITTDQ